MQIFEGKRMQIFISVGFIPRDFWVGVGIGSKNSLIGGWSGRPIHLYLLPMVPIIFNFYRLSSKGGRDGKNSRVSRSGNV